MHPKLKRLTLSSNQVSDLEFLRYTPNLIELNVSDNPLRDIGEITALCHLRSLYLWHTMISFVMGLATCSELEELGLADNDLEGVDDLRKLNHFALLFLGGNANIEPADVAALAERVSEDFRGPDWKEQSSPG
ncbi:leucine-rich repeat domain-containing protein [Lewinella sp. IMCC34183]|uniref:leucine-rich repeat domain-containing protein n=1 Tax=Lewinella sp. IMCC34183 TaxID=2248762 RepID=UPI000E23A8B0|nr:leucine-rich repeat domain-containing protein [Lewinella sp. IMCC34183]